MNKLAVPFIALSSTVSVALGANPAAVTDQNDAELRNQVAELQKQVDSLKAANNQDWLTQQRADEIRGLVQDVLADADTRASLLANGAMAGYDKGFFIGSGDGNYLLKVSGQLQVRYLYNFQDDSSGDSNRSGFENRRTKIFFNGNVFDPSWKYMVNGAFDRDGGAFILEDAYIDKEFDNGWTFRVGQFKLPYLKEELMSSKKQLAVERSLVNEEFNQDRSQGAQITYAAEQWRVMGAFSDGFFTNSVGTDNTGALAEDTEWAFTGRFEFMIAGDWKQYEEFSSWKGEDTAVFLGVAAHYQNDEYGTGDGSGLTFNDAEVEALHLTGDVMAKFGGLSLYGALVYRNLDSEFADDVDQWGIVIQGGFFIADDWELFARYEYGDFDIDAVEELSVITLGVNKYWDKHNLKWQTDIGFGLDDVSSVWASSGAGWRTDAADEDGQVVFRTQFQLLF
jgi:hypothetical protein